MCADGATCTGPVGEEWSCSTYPVTILNGRRGERSAYGIKGPGTIEISEDGQSLVESYELGGKAYKDIYKRR